MFAQSIDFDQAQRQKQDEAVESIYLEGISDGFDGRFPVMAEIIYFQGFCEGMKQRGSLNSLIITPQEEQVELPLVCGQCDHFNNNRCAIKSITRSRHQYACDRIEVNCPF